MNSPDWIRHLNGEFCTGKSVIVIKDGDPEALRKKLYKAAMRRGYNWRFGIIDKELVVRNLNSYSNLR